MLVVSIQSAADPAEPVMLLRVESRGLPDGHTSGVRAAWVWISHSLYDGEPMAFQKLGRVRQCRMESHSIVQLS